jgi:alkanesulfonate monooxygenase SsuD/methylene tetrahydromethanopterin reductase-like flavin-dependent oxidoreductase (luciferase family)
VRALQPGSIGIGLYLLDLPVTEAVGQLVSQAVLAEELGFDSATVSEHHGGFAGYLPNPLLAASWILGSTQRIWSGPNPLLLPLRDVAAVAEDLAWLAARFPGRVAAGLAAGYHPADFTLLGRNAA